MTESDDNIVQLHSDERVLQCECSSTTYQVMYSCSKHKHLLVCMECDCYCDNIMVVYIKDQI